MSTHICSFDAAPRVTRKTSWEAQKEAVLKAGRFSVFEATDNKFAGAFYTWLCRQPDVEVDTENIGYPWTIVRRKPATPDRQKEREAL